MLYFIAFFIAGLAFLEILIGVIGASFVSWVSGRSFIDELIIAQPVCILGAAAAAGVGALIIHL